MNKVFLSLGVAGVLIYSVPVPSVKAMYIDNTATASCNEQARAAGIIQYCNISVSSDDKCVIINGNTRAKNSMKSIGIKNIVIQRSSDKVNWTDEKTVSDMLSSNESNYYLNDYSVSVKGGYYYRVTCTHYAKESGLTGSSQSVDNTSNSVWVS